MNHLGLLLPSTLDRDTSAWATVTQVSPLRVKIDGDAVHLPFTPDSLLGTLAVNDRVRVALATNDDPDFKGRRLIVIGKAGGHAHTAADIVSGTLAIARIPTGTSGSTVALGDHTHPTLNQRLELSIGAHNADHNANETILFPTPDYNIGSFSYNTGTGKWQVPESGFYDVSVDAIWASAGGSGTLAEDIYISVNGNARHLCRNIVRNASEGARPIAGHWSGHMTAATDNYLFTFQNANGGSALNVDIRAVITRKGFSS